MADHDKMDILEAVIAFILAEMNEISFLRS